MFFLILWLEKFSLNDTYQKESLTDGYLLIPRVCAYTAGYKTKKAFHTVSVEGFFNILRY
jgi:hypothetical protein